MKIKKELKINYKYYIYTCYFYNEFQKGNVSYSITESSIKLKIKNKKLKLIFYNNSNQDIEIKTMKKSRILSFKKVLNNPLMSSNIDFNLIKYKNKYQAISEFLYFLLLAINKDFYIDESINVIESHGLMLHPAELQKHLKTHHGKEVYEIGNTIKNKILDEARVIVNSHSHSFGDVFNTNISYKKNNYNILDFNYKDSSRIEDQFVKFERLFLGGDFIKEILDSLKKIICSAVCECLGNDKNLIMMIDIMTKTSSMLLSKCINEEFYILNRNNILSMHLDENRNGDGYLINKISYIINFLDSLDFSTNKGSYDFNKVFFKELAVMIHKSCIESKNDLNSIKKLSIDYNNKVHMKTMIIVNDIVDSMVLEQYLLPFMSDSLKVSLNGETIKNFINIEKNDNKMNNKFFIRLQPEYNDGLYAIFYNAFTNSAMLLFQSNGKHRISVMISDVFGDGITKYFFFLNVNESYYFDLKLGSDDFILSYREKINKILPNIRSLVNSINNESFFENNEVFNVICNGKNEKLYLTYEKLINKYKIDFFKT